MVGECDFGTVEPLDFHLDVGAGFGDADSGNCFEEYCYVQSGCDASCNTADDNRAAAYYCSLVFQAQDTFADTLCVEPVELSGREFEDADPSSVPSPEPTASSLPPPS